MAPESSPKIEKIVKPPKQIRVVEHNGPTLDEIEDAKQIEKTMGTIAKIYSEAGSLNGEESKESEESETPIDENRQDIVFIKKYEIVSKYFKDRLGDNYYTGPAFSTPEDEFRGFFDIGLKNKEGFVIEVTVFPENDGSISIEDKNDTTGKSKLNFNNDSLSLDKLVDQIKKKLALRLQYEKESFEQQGESV